MISINVPSDKARAVVDAMERDMGTTPLDQKLDTVQLRITVRLGSMLIVGFGLAIAAMRLWA